MIVSFGHVLVLSGLLFLLGTVCAVARRNLIMILLGVEIMLNAATIAFVGAALRWHDMEGQVFVLFIFAVAAAEVSVGLALIIGVYRRTGSVDPNNFTISLLGMCVFPFIAAPVLVHILPGFSLTKKADIQTRAEAIFELIWKGIKI